MRISDDPHHGGLRRGGRIRHHRALDKNFLKIIRLLIERRQRFAMFGGVRFGGTLTLEQAFALGFDHVALCLGAGKPTILDMPTSWRRACAWPRTFSWPSS